MTARSPRPAPNQAELPLSVTPEQQLSRFDRIEMLGIVEGFIPVSQAELNETMAVQASRLSIGGAARHIAEVVRHQNNAFTDDPLRAARKLTHSYAGYALDAKASSFKLESLAEVIAEANPELAVGGVVDREQEGLLEFLRFFDLSQLKSEADLWKIGYDPQKVDYKPENPGIMFYLDEAVAIWRVHQLKRKVPHAMQHEGNRLGFWLESLTDIVRHYPNLRPIAQRGLDKVYNRPTE